jgi:hypothetical protein
MATNNPEFSTAVGVFDDRADAQRAVNELRRMGFSDDRIGVAYQDEAEGTRATPASHEESKAGTGAAAGAAAGAGVGALWGIGIAAGMLPAIGPVIAGGTLAAVLASAATGAAATGLAGALIGLGIPDEDAEYYEEEFKRGRTIVSVDAGMSYDEVMDVLRRYGADEHGTHTEGRGAARTRTHARA